MHTRFKLVGFCLLGLLILTITSAYDEVWQPNHLNQMCKVNSTDFSGHYKDKKIYANCTIIDIASDGYLYLEGTTLDHHSSDGDAPGLSTLAGPFFMNESSVYNCNFTSLCDQMMVETLNANNSEIVNVSYIWFSKNVIIDNLTFTDSGYFRSDLYSNSSINNVTGAGYNSTYGVRCEAGSGSAFENLIDGNLNYIWGWQSPGGLCLFTNIYSNGSYLIEESSNLTFKDIVHYGDITIKDNSILNATNLTQNSGFFEVMNSSKAYFYSGSKIDGLKVYSGSSDSALLWGYLEIGNVSYFPTNNKITRDFPFVTKSIMTGETLSGYNVTIYDEDGNFIDSDITDGNGLTILGQTFNGTNYNQKYLVEVLNGSQICSREFTLVSSTAPSGMELFPTHSVLEMDSLFYLGQEGQLSLSVDFLGEQVNFTYIQANFSLVTPLGEIFEYTLENSSFQNLGNGTYLADILFSTDEFVIGDQRVEFYAETEHGNFRKSVDFHVTYKFFYNLKSLLGMFITDLD